MHAPLELVGHPWAASHYVTNSYKTLCLFLHYSVGTRTHVELCDHGSLPDT